MERNRITNLILKHQLSSLTDEELDELMSWLREKPENERVFSDICNNKELTEAFSTFNQANPDEAWDRVLANTTPAATRIPYYRHTAAAVLVAFLLICSGGYYLWQKQHNNSPTANQTFATLDLAPAKTEARLITADGAEHNLHPAADINGFTPLTEGSLQYTENEEENTTGLNTLITPEAAIYTIFLPDGTKAMLNASSSLEFPSKFANNQREVKITGEVYFEVTSNPSRPFIVQSGDLKIKVLGTKFNINAYKRNKRIALVEGKVQVEHLAKSQTMFPNDILITKGDDLIKSSKSIDRELSWVDDLFFFEKDDLHHISEQLKLWYGVEIEIAPNINQNVLYSGKISRQAMLTDVLDILNYLTNLKFKLNEKKITITMN